MDFAVLVKAVPGLDELRFDPDSRTVRRDDAELFLNPFDQRALRVALDLRRTGERVSVLSLGPAGAAEPLRDAVALGADRVQLLSDPGLAGSDTLATARALAAGLRRVGHDVVLGGAWTTDSETGQVGPEVAAVLGRPVLTSARALTRDEDGPGLTVTVDTADGWARYRTRAPVVLTVGEKIAKPAKVAPEERSRVPRSAVELVSLSALGLAPGSVGLAGSPTVVRAVVEDAPRRVPQIVAEGTPEERVGRAIEALAPLLARVAAAPGPVPPLPRTRVAERELLVLTTGATGGLDRRALPVLSELRRSLPGHWPSAVWVGAPPSDDELGRLASAGVAAGYELRPGIAPADSRAVAAAFGAVLELRPGAAAGVFVADPFGREVAGQLAAPRGLGLVGDAVAVRAVGHDELRWAKPSFGGRTLAEISSRTRPGLATVRPGFGEHRPALAGDVRPSWTVLAAPPGPAALLPEATGTEVPVESEPLEARDVVVAVGMGVGGPKGIAALAPLLARWNAGLGATRRVVDAGWVPRQFQVGLTGRALAPRLGVLLGVGGSTNHLVGWRRARALLAVNPDPSAGVFREVDVGIVGTIAEIVPWLTEAVARCL